jgi:hypothetical protein
MNVYPILKTNKLILNYIRGSPPKRIENYKLFFKPSMNEARVFVVCKSLKHS